MTAEEKLKQILGGDLLEGTAEAKTKAKQEGQRRVTVARKVKKVKKPEPVAEAADSYSFMEDFERKLEQSLSVTVKKVAKVARTSTTVSARIKRKGKQEREAKSQKEIITIAQPATVSSTSTTAIAKKLKATLAADKSEKRKPAHSLASNIQALLTAEKL